MGFVSILFLVYILYKDDFFKIPERYNTLQAGESSWVSSTPLAIRTLVQGGVVPENCSSV
jgi:hypothetical protein